MDLTEEEIARIRGKFYWFAGSVDFSHVVLVDARRDRDDFKELLDCWQKMSAEGQAAVAVRLAVLASPGAEDGLPLVVQPDMLDLGAALQALVNDGTGRKGRKINQPGLRGAVEEAFQIWVERGNPPEIGNFRPTPPKPKMLTAQERKALPKPKPERYRPYPSLTFVANAVVVALPKELKFPNEQARLIAIDTQLRELRQSGNV